MTDESSPKTLPPIRARRWSRPPTPARKPRPYNFALRLIGIPAVAVVGVFIYSGLRDHFVLPVCDSDRAKKTLADVMHDLNFQPTRFESIKTVSSDKDHVACSADLPLPDGGAVTIEYTFYWQGTAANMKYSVSRKSS